MLFQGADLFPQSGSVSGHGLRLAGGITMLALSAGSLRDQRPQPGIVGQILEVQALLLGHLQVGAQPL